MSTDDENHDLDINSLYKKACHLKESGSCDDAKVLFETVLLRKPDCWEAYFHIGCILFGENDFQEAARSFKKSIAINRFFYFSYANLGLCFARLNRHTDAIAMYCAAIAIQPESYSAYFNLALTYSEMGKTEEAISTLKRAIMIDSGAAEAMFNLANVLVSAGRLEEAIVNYRQALTLKPDLPGGYGQLIHAKMLICDWSDFQEIKHSIFEGLENGNSTCAPFVALSLTDSIHLQRAASSAWAHRNYPVTAPAQPKREPSKDGRIRVGYYSMDYRDHPVSTLVSGLIEAHDRAKFEIFAFSYGSQTGGPMRQRMENAFDHFLDVKDMSDWEIQAKSRELGIDIAVDLAGYTTRSRPGIMALRPAPIQVSFLGFVGPQGVDYIDYLISDPVIVPEEFRELYSEKIVYLPCFQPNDGSRVISDRTFDRIEFGLSDKDFVFCCFNHSYKFSPDVFSAWMEILHSCPQGKLLLLASNSATEANLRREAAARGVHPDRLVFAGRVPPADYLARFRMADLFLDTLPYNSGTTASDALWAGLPVLTCAGEAYASRMAASLLTAIGASELITENLEDYTKKAIMLSQNMSEIARLRSKIENSRKLRGVYDIKFFTTGLEEAYQKMWSLKANSRNPEHISIIRNRKGPKKR
ncbi:O-linked N-acetylglucosamine transferase, SPINDLY family protein [Alteraurantiacibacter buctensis]|uniref:protein O-GlcNAc transferase n=1 Tax=Alteraurantiacibacter buctensis TaxID=1503981 RepID=A0A844YXN6_9SPHN|nr:tetratricopeptide repeat protein [Alteraurantiacibacter buctensis]MXO73105.1 tetratricopeptide repeat protein [Alteraurantiacibacter buctensis]